MEEWFSVADADALDTPALVVYPDRVQHNLAQLVASIDEVGRLRPHVKTHKSQEAVRLTMEAGISKFKCATIAEAEMLGLCGAPDVLLAYQPIGPKAARFVQVIKHYPQTKFSCLIDTYAAAQHLNNLAAASELTVSVFIDLNVGMNRSGIAPAAAFALYQQCVSLANLQIMGLHAYDGHIRDEDLALRTEHCNSAFALVEELADQLRSTGFDPIIVAGGSPTFPIHAARQGVECSPGTFIYWDSGYGNVCKEQPYWPAALVLSRVISLPDATKICVDLGHKSIAAESPLDKRITFLNAPALRPIGQSEEHLVLEAGPNHGYKVGDLLYGLPYHICPTVALYERAITIQNQAPAGEWKTIARDRKINL
ncbi:D-TA family PLP-dependent enzyme [Hymenobacter sp. GOD-10R]|uniref:D-TA family PLP-dependent enzyme n=1 Tax=Hymenobacter sp. GOD-10R TaxID=3093922 RepID=UPI002D7720DF|nr:D-TA family PLP-dependent enzyme [Hymenobacter sp. GOD-10R]WRQ27345.1 D-TA family PLP-dependent enzyme [Hymenobacter sp. GOD-10R]